jgi:choline dehydrogenase-like flavoprotein
MERLGMTVIGSGPAAIAATYALVKHGYHVTVLDAGIDLEPERQRVVEHLQPLAYEDWDRASLRVLREGSGATVSGVPLKRVYGSDFPYRSAVEFLGLEREHVAGFTSLARGGLSNVWGSAVMPFRLSDLADWPAVTRDALGAAYGGVFEFMPLAATEDDLAQTFPLYINRPQAFTPSSQAKALLDRMHQHRDRLHERGITFGRSRLAVQASGGPNGLDCVYCGMCMYGCPRDLIYKSSHTLDDLVRAGHVTYVPDVVVDQLSEDGTTVHIQVHHRTSGQHGPLEADRVFVACGGFGTARLMLNSLSARGATLKMGDSQYFLLPVMAVKGERGVSRARLHTLAQIFIELEDQELSSYPVHLQLYTYNDLYANAMRAMFGPVYPLVSPPATVMLNRLMVIQGYLHSNVSSTASVTLENGKLIARRKENPGAVRSVKAITKMLRRNRRSLGFSPITPMLKIGDHGQGAHIGGTFPMRDIPGPFESDVLGRPYGAQRVHLVDGSVLPSIPATTVTLSIMANAYRIASEVRRYA